MSTLWTGSPGGPWVSSPVEGGELEGTGLSLCRLEETAGGGVALLVRRGVPARVNGVAVPGGLRVLRDRDEIQAGGRRWFLSEERAPEVVEFQQAEGERPPACPVCRGPIRAGDRAVRCPRCRRWHHEDAGGEGRAERLHWTYGPTCRFCGHPTALDGAGVWSPAEEEAHG